MGKRRKNVVENHSHTEHEDKESYTCQLKIPVKYKGEVVKSVSIRRSTVADMIAIEEQALDGFINKNAHYLAVLSGHSPEMFKKMDSADWNVFVRGANDFLGMGGLL